MKVSDGIAQATHDMLLNIHPIKKLTENFKLLSQGKTIFTNNTLKF